jgi:hypothetical protein
MIRYVTSATECSILEFSGCHDVEVMAPLTLQARVHRAVSVRYPLFWNVNATSTFRGQPVGPVSKGKAATAWLFKTGPIGRPETPVNTRQCGVTSLEREDPSLYCSRSAHALCGHQQVYSYQAGRARIHRGCRAH